MSGSRCFTRANLFVSSVGHMHNTDVGGAVPATLSRTLTEVHQEGHPHSPHAACSARRDERRPARSDRQQRAPAGTKPGRPRRPIACVKSASADPRHGRRFGSDTFRQGIDDLLDYAEQQARAVIRSIPDGDYYLRRTTPTRIRSTGPPCRLAVHTEVPATHDPRLRRSDPQLASSMNMPTGGQARHALVMVGVYYALYCLDPTITLNTGLVRPRVHRLCRRHRHAPAVPAAVGMRSLTATLAQTAYRRLLPRHARPHAGRPRQQFSIMNVITADPQTGRRVMASIDPLGGGAGGSPFADGAKGSGADMPLPEKHPGRNERSRGADPGPPLWPHARFRRRRSLSRRHALDMEFKVFAPQTMVTARNRDRSIFSAWGLQGGGPGRVSASRATPARRIVSNSVRPMSCCANRATSS